MARRRPKSASPGSRQAEADSHVRRFVRYLDAECGLAKNTVAAYERDVRRFVGHLTATGGPSLTGLRLETLTDYVESLHGSDLAAASIGRAMVSVKMLLRFLQLEGLVAENVAELIASPKLWQKLPTVLAPTTIDTLLVEPKPPGDRLWRRDRAILATMYATGCRASECCGISQSDWNAEERTVLLRGKGNKERLVSLTPTAVEAVDDYREHSRGRLIRRDADALFLSRGGTRLHRAGLWELIKKYAIRVGAPASVSPHSLRHSFATHMLAGGAEIRALQEMLGHANIRTTQIYTQVDSSRMKAVHAECHPRA